MKTKLIVSLALSAMITLSFAFKTSHKDNKKPLEQTAQKNRTSEPLGGFVSEDKF